MCGRFVRTCDKAAIVREFEAYADGIDIEPSYNIAPSQNVVVVVKDKRRKLAVCRWGFIPRWSRDSSAADRMINARAETVAFSAAFIRYRCLVIADGFYEWRRNGAKKTPVLIRLKSGRPFGFAGLYSEGAGDGEKTCTIITTRANVLVQQIHDRMPVIVDKDDYELWLGQKSDALTGLLTPYPDDEMEVRDVSAVVNSPKNNSPLCLEPFDWNTAPRLF